MPKFFNGIARAGLFAVGLAFLSQQANAVVFNPAPNPIGSSTWTATSGFSESIYSNLSNSDIGNQSPANVETVLETAAWFGQELTFVGGGACGTTGVTCDGNTKSGVSTNAASVFGVHFGNNFIAFLYPTAISNFSISGLPNGVSNIYSFNVSSVPLPAALLSLATSLGLFGLWGKFRRRTTSFRGFETNEPRAT